MRAAGCALLSLIGRSFLVSHSIGATHPILLSDECPSLVAGNVNLEPATLPFQSSISRTAARPFGLTVTNLHYDPPISSSSELVTVTVGDDTPAKRSCILQSNSTANYTLHKLPNVAKVPYVAFTGEASPHAVSPFSLPRVLLEFRQYVFRTYRLPSSRFGPSTNMLTDLRPLHNQVSESSWCGDRLDSIAGRQCVWERAFCVPRAQQCRVLQGGRGLDRKACQDVGIR